MRKFIYLILISVIGIVQVPTVAFAGTINGKKCSEIGLNYIAKSKLYVCTKKGNKKIWKFESNLQEKSLPKQSDTNQIFTASRYLSEGFRNLKIEILEDNSDQWLPNVLIRIPKISLVKDAQIKIISDGFLRCSSSEIFSESTMYQLGRDTVGDQRDMYQNSADGYWEINLISNNKFVLNTNSMMGNFTQSYWTLKCLIDYSVIQNFYLSLEPFSDSELAGSKFFSKSAFLTPKVFTSNKVETGARCAPRDLKITKADGKVFVCSMSQSDRKYFAKSGTSFGFFQEYSWVRDISNNEAACNQAFNLQIEIGKLQGKIFTSPALKDSLTIEIERLKQEYSVQNTICEDI